MKLFLTGATGYIGGAVAEALVKAGHAVAGLARSEEADHELRRTGITPYRGDLKIPGSLAGGVRASDGVIHTGTTNDGRLDSDAVRAMLESLRGTNKPFVYTSGVWVLGNTGDRIADETWPLNPLALVAWRPALEQMVLAAEKDGVRAIVLRPAIVYGRAAGVPGMFVQSANETGVARYVGTGENRWPVVHVEDLAGLYVRAVEKAETGTLFHAAAGRAYRVKELAEAASFGADAGGRTESWPLEDARKTLGAFADALALDQQVSSEKARSILGWNPSAIPILEDLRSGSYALPKAAPVRR